MSQRHLQLVDADFIPVPEPDERWRDLEEVFDSAGFVDQVLLHQPPSD